MRVAALVLALWGTAYAQAVPEGLSDEDLAKLAEGEAIEIFDERPDKPFDRDTEVRITGEELAKRGAVDLASALSLLPDVTIREAGRGGKQIDIRGGRKGEVTILIDGVAVSDPYYGNFDVTSIPITDIVQIRVSTTPQSPIDGPGGPGGVIEVLTRDAIGPQLVVARVTGDTLPSFGMTGTARVALAKHWALRVSSSNLVGARELALPMNQTIDDGRRASSGAARLEYRAGHRRLAVDAFLDDRNYILPPNETEGSILAIMLIDRETSMRASAKLDDKLGKLQLQGQAWAHSLSRRTRFYSDVAMTDNYRVEDIEATRVGAMALVTAPFKKDFRWVTSTTVSREDATVTEDLTSRGHLTIIEAAGGLQYERKRFRLESAAGVAIPIGVDADPWPEAKLVARTKPTQHLELTATTGYKGRLPSLRERFDAMMGDPDLDPEHAVHAELRAVEDHADVMRLELAPFYRRSTGLIKQMGGRFANTGPLNIYGVDAIARFAIRPFELGGSYSYIRARSDRADEPLDFLPHHKLDAWLRGTYRAGSALVRAKYISTALDGGREVGNYTLVEMNVTAQLGKTYLGVLRVDDLLDKRPDVRAGYPSTGRVVSLVLQGSWD
ncbi:MAG: TonB-dependent receptor [Myxococcota bacterium]|nr:TonB-dependent receptor [Myxococcota bacterium]